MIDLESFLNQKIFIISISNNEKESFIDIEDLHLKRYHINIDRHHIECDCSYFKEHGIICKHIYYFLRHEYINGLVSISLKKFLNEDLNPKLNIYKNIIDNPITPISCCICLRDPENINDFQESSIVQCHNCHQFFHKNCIKYWLRHCVTCSCPLCRRTWSSLIY